MTITAEDVAAIINRHKLSTSAADQLRLAFVGAVCNDEALIQDAVAAIHNEGEASPAAAALDEMIQLMQASIKDSGATTSAQNLR